MKVVALKGSNLASIDKDRNKQIVDQGYRKRGLAQTGSTLEDQGLP